MTEVVNIDVAEPGFGVQVGKVDVIIHDVDQCAGEKCPFHNPSGHHMVGWPKNMRLDNRALVERICEHGVGHPDPDSVAFFKRKGMTHMGVHGCDGCCRPASK